MTSTVLASTQEEHVLQIRDDALAQQLANHDPKTNAVIKIVGEKVEFDAVVCLDSNQWERVRQRSQTPRKRPHEDDSAAESTAPVPGTLSINENRPSKRRKTEVVTLAEQLKSWTIEHESNRGSELEDVAQSEISNLYRTEFDWLRAQGLIDQGSDYVKVAKIILNAKAYGNADAMWQVAEAERWLRRREAGERGLESTLVQIMRGAKAILSGVLPTDGRDIRTLSWGETVGMLKETWGETKNVDVGNFLFRIAFRIQASTIWQLFLHAKYLLESGEVSIAQVTEQNGRLKKRRDTAARDIVIELVAPKEKGTDKSRDKFRELLRSGDKWNYAICTWESSLSAAFTPECVADSWIKKMKREGKESWTTYVQLVKGTNPVVGQLKKYEYLMERLLQRVPWDSRVRLELQSRDDISSLSPEDRVALLDYASEDEEREVLLTKNAARLRNESTFRSVQEQDGDDTVLTDDTGHDRSRGTSIRSSLCPETDINTSDEQCTSVSERHPEYVQMPVGQNGQPLGVAEDSPPATCRSHEMYDAARYGAASSDSKRDSTDVGDIVVQLHEENGEAVGDRKDSISPTSIQYLMNRGGKYEADEFDDPEVEDTLRDMNV